MDQPVLSTSHTVQWLYNGTEKRTFTANKQKNGRKIVKIKWIRRCWTLNEKRYILNEILSFIFKIFNINISTYYINTC